MVAVEVVARGLPRSLVGRAWLGVGRIVGVVGLAVVLLGAVVLRGALISTAVARSRVMVAGGRVRGTVARSLVRGAVPFTFPWWLVEVHDQERKARVEELPFV